MASVDSLKVGASLHGKLVYRITSQLGHGGFGITYLAEATQKVDGIDHDLKFCIKEFFLRDKCSREASGWVNFNTDEKTEKNGKSDFKKEAEILKSLNEVPGIVPVSEIIEANNTVYYVMQYLDGQTLDKKIHTETRLEENAALPIIRKVGKALGVLHNKNMMHLDVKPENIMLVDKFGEINPVLIDFGLSRSYNMFGRESSGKKIFAISEGYSPVEQYGIINSFHAETDVYALAATLFHMLTGEVPKPSKDITDSYVKETMKKYGVSEKVENAIACAMRKEMSDRTGSVKQFLDALVESSSNQGGGGTIPIGGTETDPPKMKYFLIAGAIALVAVLCLLFGRGGDSQGGGGGNGPVPEDTPIVVPPTPEPDNVPEIKTGNLKIDFQPKNAEVLIDGTKLGTSPNTFKDLSVGSHSVEIRKDGYNSKTETVSIVGGQTYSLSGSLTKIVVEEEITPPPTPARTLKIGDYATWQGGVRNGKPHGQGTMTFIKSHRIDPNCEDVANAGDKVTGTYVNGLLDNGTWQSPGKPDKFLLLGN